MGFTEKYMALHGESIEPFPFFFILCTLLYLCYLRVLNFVCFVNAIVCLFCSPLVHNILSNSLNRVFVTWHFVLSSRDSLLPLILSPKFISVPTLTIDKIRAPLSGSPPLSLLRPFRCEASYALELSASPVVVTRHGVARHGKASGK